MSEQHGVAQELPPAYVPPAYIAPTSALEQPALGLVLLFAALASLPQAAMMVAQATQLGIGLDRPYTVLLSLTFGGELLQLLAGLAIAWQWRARWPLFFAFVACGVALVVSSIVWRDELGARQSGVIALETIGSPLLVILAPRLFGITRITRGHALGGLLLVSAVSTLVFQPVNVIDHARTFSDGETTLGGWIAVGINTAVVVATAILQLLAGLRMARGLPARRWLGAAVIVALAGHGGLGVLGVGYWLFDEWEPHTRLILTSQLIGLAVTIARPLVVWQFAKRETEGATRVDAALPWIALMFVPQLAARCLLAEQMTTLLGSLGWPIVALCAAAGIASLIAARASLRDEHSVWAWRVAAAVAASLLALVVYWALTPDFVETPWRARGTVGAVQIVPPLALLFATMVTGAWLARRVPSTR